MAYTPTGIIQPLRCFSVANDWHMPAPHTLERVMTGVSRPAAIPRKAGGAISALYEGTEVSILAG